MPAFEGVYLLRRRRPQAGSTSISLGALLVACIALPAASPPKAQALRSP